jgi:hypothetical protein
MLTRDQILGLDDLPREEVAVPEWGGSVYVRALTGGERHELSKLLGQGDVTSAAIVALFAVDAQGSRLFTEADVEALEAKNGAALDRIVAAALRFNTLTEDSVEAGKDD